MKWIETINRMYKDQVAHCFIVHGNIHDYVVPGVRLAAYISKAYANRDFIEFSPASGLRFRSVEARKRLMDLVDGAPKSESDNIFDAMGISDDSPDERDNSPYVTGSNLQLIDLLYQLACAQEVRKDKGKDKLFHVRPVILIHGGDMLVPPSNKSSLQPEDRAVLAKLREWGNDAQLDNAGPTIIMTTSMIGEIHPDLVAASSKWEAINIPMPTREDRKNLIDKRLATFAEEDAKAKVAEEDADAGDAEEMEIEAGFDSLAIANATSGLSLVHTEDTLLTGRSAGKLTMPIILDRKRTIVDAEYSGLLVAPTTRLNEGDVGGHQLIKDFFRNEVIEPLRTGDVKRAVKGVLLVGPSGTGKSILAQMLAGMADMNFVELVIGNIADKFQGEGEKKIDKALNGTLAYSPTIVFLDEVDQAIGRGNGSNAQDARIFQRILTFTGDNSIRGKVVFVYGSNRPDLLDAAFMRPGRIDAIIPVLPPTDKERVEIIRIMTQKYMGVDVAAKKIDADMIASCDGWTGAEIESAVRKASRVFDKDPVKALKVGFAKILPNTKQIDLMTRLAIECCNDMDLLPEAYRNRAERKAAAVEAEPVQTERRGRRT